MVDITQAAYEELEAIAKRFDVRSEAIEHLRQTVIRQVERVRQSWAGDAAEAFGAEMAGDVAPAVVRLIQALSECGATTRQVSAIMRQAEEEAARLFEAWGIDGDLQKAPPAGATGATGDSSGGADSAPAQADESWMPQWLSDALEMILLGDFSDKTSILGIVGQVLVGLVPIAGQIADVRDIIAGIKNVVAGEPGAWIFLGISVVAIIPGLDALKAAKVLKPLFKALGDKGSREVVEYLLKNPREIGRLARTVGSLVSNPNVVELLAKNPDAALQLIKQGSPELVEAYGKHGQDAVDLAMRYGDDGPYVASQYDRYPDLAKDPAHGGRADPKTYREAGVGLALEGQNKLPGPITRYPTAAAEFTDASGQAWDVKTFNSKFPGSFRLNTHIAEIKKEIGLGENIIVDTKDMTPADIQSLRNAITAEGLDSNVIWYP